MIHLRRAEELALQTQNRAVACWAVLEQCYAEALAGRRPDAARLSERAFGLANNDSGRLAAAHAFAGFNLADWGRYAEADRAYDMSLAFARTSGAARREGWALGLGAWSKLRGGNAALAVEWAREAIDLCSRLDWLSFRPWPEAVLAEAEFAAAPIRQAFAIVSKPRWRWPASFPTLAGKQPRAASLLCATRGRAHPA